MSEGFTLLPAPPGTCPRCAVRHEPEWPHNQESLFWHYHFRAHRGRWPTWRDALEHCTPEMKALWKEALEKRGEWSEPESEVPDVLPTVHRTIGTVTTVNVSEEPEDVVAD